MNKIREKVLSREKISKQEIIKLISILKTNNSSKKNIIYNLADEIRKINMGDEIFIRGIIEFSNICRKNCDYCGIRGGNSKAPRYRIPDDEIIKICVDLKSSDVGTVVLQSGEDLFYTKKKLGNLIKQIKLNSGLSITLSVGERDPETYAYWKECGMDRYLLRFETSNKKIFQTIHPDDDYDYRINCIKTLKKMGVQTGSGFMIGLPEATDEDIADDILLCSDLKLDMIGIGPFIPHPDTPLNYFSNNYDINFFTGIISILRIANPESHIPATTAFDAIDKNGRQLCLQRGANIFMPNITPAKYRPNYILYPNKPCVDENAGDCIRCVKYRVKSIGRTIGKGPGNSYSKLNIR